MKLVQLNAWGGKLQYQIPKFLLDQNPDIVCLQEMHDLKGSSGTMFLTLEELQQRLGYPYVEMAPAYNFRFMNRQVEYGNVIVSRPKVVAHQVVFTQGVYKKDYDMVEDEDIRNFQHVQLMVNGVKLNVINYHGPYIDGSKEGTADTIRQLAMLGDYIDGLKGAVIVVGDFNLSPTCKSLDGLNARLRNLPVEFGVSSTYTGFSIHNLICDYIFVNDAVTVHDFSVADDLVSDHRPLILDFSI